MNRRRLFPVLFLAALPLAGCQTESTSIAPSDSLAPIPAPKASATPTTKAKGTATGKVVGVDGKPVAGVTVWVTVAYYGMRRNEEVFTATTDANGTYRVEGLPDVQKHKGFPQSDTGMELFADAVTAGRPPAHVDFWATTNETVAPDLVLPAQGASLSVRVLNEAGQPAANALVQIYADENRQWAHRSGEGADALNRALHPRAKTDANGVARFTGLLPGRYRLRSIDATAQTDPNNAVREPFNDVFRLDDVAEGKIAAQASGVPVMLGQENRYTIRLQTARGNFLVRYRLPDGTLYRGTNANIRFARASSPERRDYGGSSSGGNEGRAEWDFSQSVVAGSQRVSTQMATKPPHDSAQKEPFLWSETVIVHSPYWKRDTPVTLPLLRRVGTGSLRVRVLDENDKPVAGKLVAQSNPFRDESGKNPRKTNAQGYAEFLDLSSGELLLSVVEPPILPGSKYDSSVVFPADETLRNRHVWRTQRFLVGRGERIEGVLKAERVGFVQGTITGRKQGEFPINYTEERERNTKQLFNPATGAYLLGPLPVGAYPLSYRDEEGGYKATVTVPNGVLKHNFATDPRHAYSHQKERESDSKMAALDATVFLPDGTTPALNASVWVTDAVNLSPRFGFVADATGRLRRSGLASRGVPSDLPRDRYPALLLPSRYNGSVIVAFLPGSHGATVLPFPVGAEDKPVRLTLPPALAATGTVTVGGHPLSSVPGFVSVRATPVDQGQVSDLLAVETTAQANGSFTLAGLTPGVTYGVQASLENVYLSPEVRVSVPANASGNLSALALKLPQPGKPVVVSVGGKYTDAHATLVEKLPQGSLAAQTCPLFYVVDGAGDLRVEGLPVGKWRLRLPDGKTVAVTVAPETF